MEIQAAQASKWGARTEQMLLLVSQQQQVKKKRSPEESREVGGIPDSREDPKSKTPNYGLQYSYGVESRISRWIYFSDPLRGLG